MLIFEWEREIMSTVERCSLDPLIISHCLSKQKKSLTFVTIAGKILFPRSSGYKCIALVLLCLRTKLNGTQFTNDTPPYQSRRHTKNKCC